MGKVNRAVLKFPLNMDSGKQVLRMPPGAVIRHVDWQCNSPSGGKGVFIWAECPFVGDSWSEKAGPYHTREFHILTTGENFPDTATFVGTVVLDGPWDNHAGLMLHVVETTV